MHPNHHSKTHFWATAALLISVISVSISPCYAKSKEKKKRKEQPQTEEVGIYLIGHLPLTGTTVSGIAAASDPQSLTLVSFADPSNPKTVRTFEGVTAVWSDRERELIYLANADGLWGLQVYSAADKRAEEQFDEMIRSSHSGDNHLGGGDPVA